MTIKAFNKWSTDGISVIDKGLQNYISLESTMIPRTGARYAGRRFHKSKVFIVERFMNKLMIPGHKGKKHTKTSGFCTGKAQTAYLLLERAFKIIEARKKENPLKVFVKAVENAAPREEVLAIEYGGARYPRAIDVAPQRRVDLALRYLMNGAYQKSFNSKKAAVTAIADEIIAAYDLSPNSFAITKKHELERQADASR